MGKLKLKKIINIILKHKIILRFGIGIIPFFIFLIGSVLLKEIKIIIPVIIMFIGAFMNFLVVFSNGFKMPVLRLQRGERTKSERHFLYNPEDKIKFKFLTDRFVFGFPVIRKRILKDFIIRRASIGDILIISGLILFWINILFQL